MISFKMKVRRGGSPSSWRTYQLCIYWFPASVRLARCPRASGADRLSIMQPRGPFCGLGAALPLCRRRRSRPCVAPKIADQHHVYTEFHTCEFFSDD